ncbi:zinc finger MYM-type 1-like protein [Labeo rohita]|uniref:Zinc finger MYM-type 1-like protein n=2 Tax=Labeo rohita TaxID=84645 RepID=A0A498P0R3_LABRO|nr:zinc finger MYM-type 1-like protein [Labeo rohita]RXN37144.1 zinc finger MYM-type 1-like protein [Labeo rohita]
MSLRAEQVKKKRQVMERIVDVIKVIGKCGLSYRGDNEEAGYSLENIAVNHGNILELILLLSRYDICLQQHVNTCIENSKKQHETGAKGRGALVTLLSKETFNKVVDVIGQLIKLTIAEEVRQAGMFSVQLDTTQDISSKDQCSIILRYVTDVIQERLIAVVDCESSTGQSFVELLKKVLLNFNIDIGTCVGNSTDGAANMQGQFRGFSTLLSEHSPNQVHIWCYSHLLNLVLADTTGSVVESASLFSLLNDIAVFLRESYKRMQKWEEKSQDTHHRRLCPIGPTRWWAKDQALSKVFGCFRNPQGALFFEVLMTLDTIVEDKAQKPTVRAKAKGFVEVLLKYETVLTAQLFLRIFELISPLSKYLQTRGMDIITAQRLVEGTEEGLSKCARDFEGVKCAADEFVKWANGKLQEEEECELVVQAALSERRIRKKKKMSGELAEDEQLMDSKAQLWKK